MEEDGGCGGIERVTLGVQSNQHLVASNYPQKSSGFVFASQRSKALTQAQKAKTCQKITSIKLGFAPHALGRALWSQPRHLLV